MGKFENEFSQFYLYPPDQFAGQGVVFAGDMHGIDKGGWCGILVHGDVPRGIGIRIER